jgi:hypothetical protein
MGFDWGAFATGFLKETAKNINEAKEDAKQYEERQRELAERNKLTISKRNAVANEVISISNMLRDNGASQAVIQAAISAGPKAIADLANKVNNARDIYGRKLNSDDIETLVNMPENFSVIDMDTEDFIKKTYGLGYEGAGTTESKPERTLMDRLSGRKLRDMARYRLDSEVMQDGLTAYDINQMAAQTDYESLVPGTFITFNEVKYFNPATDMASFSRTFTSLVDDVEDSAEFKEIEREINRAKNSVEGELADISDEDRAKLVQEVLEKRNALYRRSLQPYVDSMVSTYGDSFLDNTKENLKYYLGDAYVDSLSFEPEEDEEQEAGPQRKPVPEVTTDDLTEATPPDVQMFDLPDMQAPEGEEADVTVTGAEDEEIERVDEPRGLMSPKEEGVPEGYITIEMWENMTREKREEAGLPKTKLGVQQIVRGGLVPLPSLSAPEQGPMIESVRGKFEKKTGLSQEKLQELIDTGRATEMDLQLVTDSGDDILDFIKDGNYALSNMGITEGLSDWANKNKKQLPFDMNFLIKFVAGTLRASQE